MTDMKACILSISGETLTDDEIAFLKDANPWGLILMGRSIKTKTQVKALTQDIWATLGRGCLIFTDQEGGRVRRMRPPEWPEFPAAFTFLSLYRQSEELGLEAAWLSHRLMAHEMREIGIYADCAPDLDLRIPGAHEVVGDRAFGETPEQVIALARAALNGLHDGGVAGVIKHMPGHGRAMVDTHKALPIVEASEDELATDFAAFVGLKDAEMGMTAHIAYTAYDADNAGTISSTIIGKIIRDKIGFDGLLMTDDLGMDALGGSLGSRASMAIEAGCDIALHCAGFKPDAETILKEMIEIADIAPTLSGKSLARAEGAEQAATSLQPFDIEAGWERLEELLAKTRMAGV